MFKGPGFFVKHCPKKCDKCNSTNMKKPEKVTARALEVQARILPSKKADQTEFMPEIVNHFRSPSCYKISPFSLDPVGSDAVAG